MKLIQWIKGGQLNEIRDYLKGTPNGANQQLDDFPNSGDSYSFKLENNFKCVYQSQPNYQFGFPVDSMYGDHFQLQNHNQRRNFSALHLAVLMSNSYGHNLDIVFLLIESGANINSIDAYGCSPLHVAVLAENVQAVKMLLNTEACDLSINNQNGETVEDICNSRSPQPGYEKVQVVMSIRPYFEGVVANPNKNNKSDTNMSLISKLISMQKNKQALRELATDVEKLEFSDIDSKIATKKVEITNSKSRSEQLQNELHALEVKIPQLEDELRGLQAERERMAARKKITIELDDDSLECPVCMILPAPPKKVYQCTNGHIHCSDCRQHPQLTHCPECRVPLQGELLRNLTHEKLVAKQAPR